MNEKFEEKCEEKFGLLQIAIMAKDEELNELKKELENEKNKNNNINQNNIQKEKIIHENDLATVYFTSVDQKINFAVPCLKSSIFAEVEEKLYKEYPEYRETNNSFLANGMQILRFKTIEENNIGKGRPVMLLNPNSDDQ